MATFKARLKKLGVSQRVFAEFSGIHSTHVSRYIHGWTIPAKARETLESELTRLESRANDTKGASLYFGPIGADGLHKLFQHGAKKA